MSRGAVTLAYVVAVLVLARVLWLRIHAVRRAHARLAALRHLNAETTGRIEFGYADYDDPMSTGTSTAVDPIRDGDPLGWYRQTHQP